MWINLKFLHIMCRVFIQNIHFFLPTFCFESTICVTYFNIHLLLFTLFNFLGEQSIFFRYTKCTICGVLSQFMPFCCDLRCFVAKTVLSRFTRFCRENSFVAIYALLCGEKMNQELHMWRKNDGLVSIPITDF